MKQKLKQALRWFLVQLLNLIKKPNATENNQAISIPFFSVPYVLFIFFLAVVYIYNSYSADKKIRQISDLKKTLKELNYEYISANSELMKKSKQNEVAKLVRDLGLRELNEPAKKISIPSK